MLRCMVCMCCDTVYGIFARASSTIRLCSTFSRQNQARGRQVHPLSSSAAAARAAWCLCRCGCCTECGAVVQSVAVALRGKAHDLDADKGAPACAACSRLLLSLRNLSAGCRGRSPAGDNPAHRGCAGLSQKGIVLWHLSPCACRVLRICRENQRHRMRKRGLLCASCAIRRTRVFGLAFCEKKNYCLSVRNWRESRSFSWWRHRAMA